MGTYVPRTRTRRTGARRAPLNTEKIPLLLSVRYHIEPGNLIFSRHIKVHSLQADKDHYSLSVTTRHANRMSATVKLSLLIPLISKHPNSPANGVFSNTTYGKIPIDFEEKNFAFNGTGRNSFTSIFSAAVVVAYATILVNRRPGGFKNRWKVLCDRRMRPRAREEQKNSRREEILRADPVLY